MAARSCAAIARMQPSRRCSRLQYARTDKRFQPDVLPEQQRIADRDVGSREAPCADELVVVEADIQRPQARQEPSRLVSDRLRLAALRRYDQRTFGDACECPEADK